MIKDIGKGIRAYAKALRIINKLNLWRFFLIPVIIGLLLGFLFISTAYNLSDDFGAYLADFWPFEFGKNFVTGLSSWLAGFILIIIGVTLYKHVLMALSSPFMTPASEKVEAYLTGKENVTNTSRLATQLSRSIHLNFKNLIKELAITLPLMLLSFVPLFGLIAVVLIFYFQSYYTGFGNMDYTLERYFDYKGSKVFVKKNKGLAVGNGAIFTLMVLIPIVGAMITLPIAAIAATINTVDRLSIAKK